MMGEVLGGCDSVSDEIVGPWSTEVQDIGGEQVCADFEQTESNTLY